MIHVGEFLTDVIYDITGKKGTVWRGASGTVPATGNPIVIFEQACRAVKRYPGDTLVRYDTYENTLTYFLNAWRDWDAPH